METLYEPAAFLVIIAAAILTSGGVAFTVMVVSLVLRKIWNIITKPKQSKY